MLIFLEIDKFICNISYGNIFKTLSLLLKVYELDRAIVELYKVLCPYPLAKSLQNLTKLYQRTCIVFYIMGYALSMMTFTHVVVFCLWMLYDATDIKKLFSRNFENLDI